MKERFSELTESLRAETDEALRSALRAELRQILTSGQYQAPMDALGAKRLWADDPESVAEFQKIIASHRDAIAQGQGARNQEYRDYWNQPDEVLVRESEGSILVDTVPPEGLEKIRRNLANPFAALAGYESFRGKRISYCDLVPEHLRERAYQDMEPAEMLVYADELAEYYDAGVVESYQARVDRLREISDEGFLSDAPKPGHEEEYERLSREIPPSYWEHLTVAEAVSWLRFWAGEGFPLYAWY